MTKAELFAALKDFPDDMNIYLEVNGGLAELMAIKIECIYLTDMGIDDDAILLMGCR